MTRAIAFGVLACALAGCGTVANLYSLSGNREVYGGVQHAADDVREMARRDDGVPCPWLVWPLLAADLSLSAVGDTLTLPFTVAATIARRIQANQQANWENSLTDEQREALRKPVPPPSLEPMPGGTTAGRPPQPPGG